MRGIFKNTRNRPQAVARNRQIFDLLRHGYSPKEIAERVGMNRNQVYQHILYLGFRPVYLSTDERALLMTTRHNSPVTYDEHARTLG